MKTRININNTILLITSLFAFFWLIFIIIQVNTHLTEALNIDKSKLEIKDYLVGLGHLFVLIFNIYAIIMIFSHLRHYQELKVLKTIFLICGIVSLFSIGVEKVMVDEIAREYRAGMSISEISMLNAAYIINMVFSCFVFYFVLRAFPILKDNISEKGAVDEKIFTIAQYMGILSGLMGLLLVFDLAGQEIMEGKLAFYTPFFILFMIPYALAVLYWLYIKHKQKIRDWYDEKQLQDILKASLTTLVLSIPGLVIFLFLGIPSIFYFFLYYLFLTLILFSASTLVYYKL